MLILGGLICLPSALLEQVRSCAQEAEFRLCAFLKARCLGRLEGLVVLPFEKALHAGAANHQLKKSPAPESMAGTWNLARMTFGKELEGKEKNCETLQAALSRKYEMCTDIDGSFPLDAAYWKSFLGELGEQFLADLLAVELPSADKPDRCSPAQAPLPCCSIC